MSHIPGTAVRRIGALVALAFAGAWPVRPAHAQDPKPPADTAAADTTKDALAREIDRLLRDTAGVPLPDYPRAAPAQQPRTFQSLNPDISAIGELLADLSPQRAATLEDGSRFLMRETELGIQAIVDPFFRADFFIGVHPEEVEVEEAYVTALALPGGLQARVGRFHLPLGKINLTHRPEILTVDYPLVLREYFGEEGFASSGLGLSRIFTPLGFFQEVQVYALSGIEREEEHGEEEGEAEEAEVIERQRDVFEQLAFLGHLRNYWDLSSAANVELGFSAAVGSVERLVPLPCDPSENCPLDQPPPVQQTFETQAFYGADFTMRWRPPQRSIYRSFAWNTEVVANDTPEQLLWGGFTQAQWQLSRRWYLGARFDAVQTLEEHEETEGAEPAEPEWRRAASGYLTFFPSEFSRFKLGVERELGALASDDPWRVIVQTTFAIGPHRPHAF